jgi:hypothetical protein
LRPLYPAPACGRTGILLYVPDESDSVAWTRAFARVGGDVDAEMSFYGPDPLYDLSAMGNGIFEGRSAIRAFLEGWMNSYELYEEELQEIRDLGVPSETTSETRSF